MANPEHLKILKQGVEVWNRWREVNPKVRPELEEAQFAGASLQHVNFRNAHLRQVNFQSTYLQGAQLDGADLTRARLLDCFLYKSHLKRCILKHAHLEGAHLEKADLEEANFVAASLEDANLHGATLVRAVFSRADLAGAKFIDADLRDADLTDTTLMDTDLGGAILLRANLRDSNLVRAVLRGTNLKGADFTGAIMGYTSLGDLDLSQSKGLETIQHIAPSTIGVDTLMKSRGEIPERFLEQLGVPKTINDYILPLIRKEVIEFYSSFISYSHSDRGFARLLRDQLQTYSIRCWLDEHDLKPGDRILDVVNDAIRLHDKILLCCSESSLNSWWVKDEIRKAQERERKEGRLIIIPLNLDGYLFEWSDGLASDLTSRLAADFTGWEHDNAKFEEQFERVAKALRTDESGRESPPEAEL